MSYAVEWIYEVVLKLPKGFRIVRLKNRFSHLKYHRFALHRKTENPIGTYHERYYWPKTPEIK